MTLDDLKKMAHEVSSSPSIHHSETVALARAVLALTDVAEAARTHHVPKTPCTLCDALNDMDCILDPLPPEVPR